MRATRITAPALVLLASCAAGTIRAPDPVPARKPGTPGLARAQRIAYSTADELTPTVAADGRRVAYVSTETGNLDIMVRDRISSGSQLITVSAADDFDPSFAPRSDRLVFASRRNDAKGDIFVADADGGGLEQLTDTRTGDRQPVFSSDEKRVYFTQVEGLGEEHIALWEEDVEGTRVVSPTPGFDPAPAPSGKYLFYTAPPPVGGRAHPHVVALRLADGATRAITLGESPAGFARFVTETASTARVVLVRFPDDDDGDGALDAHDRASLWSVDVALDRLFAAPGDGDRAAVGPLWPLTAGGHDELFPCPSGEWIYFTESAGSEQNVSRIPRDGVFPRLGDPAQAMALAESLEDPRERWFAYRAAAVSAPDRVSRARAQLAIVQIHLDAKSESLARAALGELLGTTGEAAASDAATSDGGAELVELEALARVELIALDRAARLARSAGARERDHVIAEIGAALSALPAGSPRLVGRIALEQNELRAASGDRLGALDALDRLIVQYAEEPAVAGAALLRRTELLRVDFDPQALAEAYGEVITRFPGERRLVAEASRRIVRGWALSGQDEVAALRTLLGRTELVPVRIVARQRIADVLRAAGALDLAAVELAALEEEAARSGDVLVAAFAQRAHARIQEERGAHAEALRSWMRLRERYLEVPGFDAEVGEAITRVALDGARRAEAAGRTEEALASYRAVLENDPRQVKAHRRSLALSATLGRSEAAVAERRAALDASPEDATLRYAYGLALTYLDPPDLEGAREELEAAVRSNPLQPAGLLALGWVEEMLHAPGRPLIDRAIISYGRAVRVARNVQDEELEAEALLGLGNARWRLAHETNDAGNFFAAFRSYMDLLATDYAFERKETALVFWERLSRAATWSERWSVAAMAGREAIALSTELRQTRRVAQIWATLALAYTRAHEPGYAELALAEYAAALSADERPARLAIAERNMAMVRLDAIDRDGAGDPGRALDDLARARGRFEAGVLRQTPAVAALLEQELSASRERVADFAAGKPGGSVIPTLADATRAPFGFDAADELDLNLALSARALHEAGEPRRAQRVESARREMAEARLDDEAAPALSRVRQWLGLALRDARAEACQRIDDTCRARLGAIWSRLAQLIESPDVARFHPHLKIERARVLAIALELDAERPREASSVEGGSDEVLPDVEGAIQQALEDTRVLALGPLDAESPPRGQITDTSSTALVTLGQLAQAAAGAHARVLHARGLRALMEAEARPRGADLPAILASIDAADAVLSRARSHFAEAVGLAARVPTPLGARLYALSLHGVAEATRRGATGPVSTSTPTDVLATTSTLAVDTSTLSTDRPEDAFALRQAARLGFPDLVPRLRIAAALASGTDDELLAAIEALADVWPDRLPRTDPLLDRAFARARSVAVARDDAELALALVDRRALLALATGNTRGVEAGADLTDQGFIAAARAALAGVRMAEDVPVRVEQETPREAWLRLEDARRRRIAARARLAEVSSMAASIAVRGRVLAEPAGADAVRAALGADHALLVPFEADGRVAVLLVSGSTTTETPLALATTTLESAPLLVHLSSLRASIDAGQVPTVADVEAARRFGEELLAAHADALAGVRTLVVADTLAPLSPAVVFPGRAVAQVSAPTALAAAGEQLSVGLTEAWALSASTIGGARALTAADLRALAAPPPSTSDIPPVGALAARPPALHLAGRPIDLFVVDVPLHADERTPERARLSVGGEPATAPLASRDAILALSTAALPARAVVLTQAQQTPDPGIDLALAVRGVASIVVIPAALDRATSARIVAAIERDRATLGLATAVSRAVSAEPSTTPGLAGIAVLGVPGLDPAGERALAEREHGPLVARTRTAVKAGRFAEAAPQADEYVRALTVLSPAHAQLLGAHQLAAVSFERAGRWDRAAEVQASLVAYLEGHASADVKKKNLLAARIALGSYLSRAGDVAASDAALDTVERELVASNDQLTLATVLTGRGLAARKRNDFVTAARAYERAIAAYDAAGAYRAADVPPAAQDVVRVLADLALNQLSDSARARVLYTRALGYTKKPDQRAAMLLALARVARRRGELAEASQRAEAAGEAARAAKLDGVALEALIESTNIAWYRGDLALGRALCARSLAEAEKQLQATRADRVTKTDIQERRVIYSLSVCGLVEMSSGDFDSAERTLLSAIRRARARGADLEGEAATQYNNLGRVYLEYGRLAQAVETFERAAAIDERRADRFGLAYDLRNLGTAQAALGRAAEAEETLTRALALSEEVQDDNNRLRALMALADVSRDTGRLDQAVERYRAALPVAERTDNADLGSQIHRSLGRIHRDRGDAASALRSLEAAVAQSRRLPGRTGATEYGPHRFAAFDDLIHLHLAAGRVPQAFAVAEEARAIAQLALLDDERLARLAPTIAADLGALRLSTSATVAAAARQRLAERAPAVAARLALGDADGIARSIPADALVLAYRATDDGLVLFTLGDGTTTATVVPVVARQLGERLLDYRRRLDRRADLGTAHADLSRWLLEPIRARLDGKRRLAVVAPGGLGAVAFAALPWGQGALIDAVTLVSAPDPTAAAAALRATSSPLAGRPIVALASPAGGPDRPLPFAPHEVSAIREAQPQTTPVLGEAASSSRLLDAASAAGTIAHFAGHSRLSATDPFASALVTAGEPLSLATILAARLDASMVVLSACETLAPPEPALSPAAVARREPISLASAFSLAGARAVLATAVRVDDVSSALLMKRFYRAAADHDPAEALRIAQQVVRGIDPHPASWASFSLLVSRSP